MASRLPRAVAVTLLLGLAATLPTVVASPADAAVSIQPDAVGFNGDVRVDAWSSSPGKDKDQDKGNAKGKLSDPIDVVRKLAGKDGLVAVDRLDLKGNACKDACSLASPSGKAFGWFVVKASNDYLVFRNRGDFRLAQFGRIKGHVDQVTFVTPVPAAAPFLLAGLAALVGLHRLRRNGSQAFPPA